MFVLWHNWESQADYRGAIDGAAKTTFPLKKRPTYGLEFRV